VKVPDLVIQEREKDLVLATFGRGFYVLDDYSPLRDASKELFEKDAHIFPIKDALMYIINGGKYGQGATYYKAPNPDFGAVFTYYLKDVPKTLKSERKKKEKELFKEGKPIPQPTYEELKAENDEIPAYLIFSIKDENGEEVKKITKKAGKGMKRVVWDLTYDSYNPITAPKDEFDPGKKPTSTLLALPGKYTVTLSMVHNGEMKELVGPTEFTAKVLKNTTLPADNRAEQVAFHKKALSLAKKVVAARNQTGLIILRAQILS
jgi:hypothetical protein